MGDRPETPNNHIPLLEKTQARGAMIVGAFFTALACFASYGATHSFPGDQKPMGPIGFLFGAILLLMAFSALRETFRYSGWAVRLDDDALAVLRRGREVRRVPWSAIAGMRYRGPAVLSSEYSHIDVLDDGGRVLLTIPVNSQSRARKWEKLDLIKKIEDRMPPDAKRLSWPWQQATPTARAPNVPLSTGLLIAGAVIGVPALLAVLKIAGSLRDDTPPIPLLAPYANLNGLLLLGGLAALGAIAGTIGAMGLARARWPGAFETKLGEDAKPYFEFMAAHGGRPQAVQLAAGKTYRYAAPRHHLSEANTIHAAMILLYVLMGLFALILIVMPPKQTAPSDAWSNWAGAGIALTFVWFCEWGRRVSKGLAKDVESRFIVSQTAVTVQRKDGTGLQCDLPKKWPKPKRSHSSFGSVLGRLRSGKEVVVVDPRYLVEVDES